MRTKTKILSALMLSASLIFSSQDSKAQFWNLIGNSGTNEASNFVGTLDTMGLTFRTANSSRMRIVGNRAADIAAGRSGFVGIGTTLPTSKLHVVGSILSTDNVVAQDTLRGAHFQMTSGAVANRYLKCDAAGNGTWSTLTITETDPQVGANTTSRVPRWNGTALVTGTIFDNATNIGIGTVAPTQKLHVIGNILTSGNVNATNFIGTGSIDVTGHVGFGSVEELTDGGANTIASNSSFVPTVDNARDLGTSALRWNNVFTGGDVYIPGNLRNDNTTGAQIIKVSTTAGSDCGIQFNRPGTGFFDFRMVNIGGNLRWQGSSDEFTTVNNEFMNLNLSTGSLGIGTFPGTAKLSVCGTVRCTELRVETGWCDYVFAKDYKLRPIEDVAAFIEENHHLPEIDPSSVIETDGLNVGEMSAKMIKKIEELTLYVIQQNDRITALEKENVQLKNSHK